MRSTPATNPFSGPILGVGIDLMDAARIRRAVAREGADFLREFLRPTEIDRCHRTRYPVAAAAAAFAAKEAFFKALGTGRAGKISWHDVEVLGLEGGSKIGPRLRLTGEASEIARKKGVTSSHLAVASLGGKVATAVATVVLEGARRHKRLKRTL
ncbi:MAG: holo-ACP synthase [Pseudomonadota bacterium]